jgi:choline dehydrogenase-like flavoprotein
VGTAAILPRQLAGVVSEKLLVYGVKGLSVVDASVMPDLPWAYTQQTAYAIAEKVSSELSRLRLSPNSARDRLTTDGFKAADLIKARA